MVRMIADRPFTYAAQDLSKGQEFDCADEHETLFTLIEFAHVKQTKQTYDTRVMTARAPRQKRVSAA